MFHHKPHILHPSEPFADEMEEEENTEEEETTAAAEEEEETL